MGNSRITGTTGIEYMRHSSVSLDNSLRHVTRPRLPTLQQPFDTPSAQEVNYCAPVDEALAEQLFTLWNEALASGDARYVASLYSDDAVLLPTVSNLPRSGLAEIEAYFKHFLLKQPSARVLQRIVRKGCNKLTDAGVYEFTVGGEGVKRKVVKARYTFVYAFHAGRWKILHHHSSVMPN
ncbi:SgcJ/EcaC family oxidoreductase [Thiomicrospira cyclica]|jgi:uncharacterized protein (TIGR02246 family)|uniref:Calcium/calmodulin dependent protein kinase II association-domain protein n=1 Tax=Thiomicrospira cyclica (strain DSM 14477 / JCM 11371 / ALM1) TaxID=717773 RepID=F6DAX3_THICA|nr:SgcJ/EcaC family oxidoreductase [Thiomicrospira cyclica]AEG32306.1 Calcium/calmodulin dependent protein kinase II association-domain protein [Thiomicrospira cyclica ALM1]